MHVVALFKFLNTILLFKNPEFSIVKLLPNFAHGFEIQIIASLGFRTKFRMPKFASEPRLNITTELIF